MRRDEVLCFPNSPLSNIAAAAYAYAFSSLLFCDAGVDASVQQLIGNAYMYVCLAPNRYNIAMVLEYVFDYILQLFVEMQNFINL